jgi:hypothetical protein
MSILRGIGKFFGGFLFSTLLAIAILTLSLAQLTEYNNLKSIAIKVSEQQIAQQIGPTQLTAIHAQILELCKGVEKIEMPFDNENITIKCSDIVNSKPEDLGKIIVTSKFDEIYYKKYDCGFLECLQREDIEGKMVIFSATANSFFKETLNYLLIGIAISAIILAISTKGWGRPKSFGICCISAGIPFFVINIIKGMLPIPKEATEIATPVVEQIFNSISFKFLIVFIVGIVLFAIGFIGEFLTKKKVKKK